MLTGVAGSDMQSVASLFADRSRIAMLDLLMDGREHAVTALARAARIASSTAVGHLARPEAGGLVVTRRAGRHRLVRLAGPAAAAAYEALSELASEPRPSGLRGLARREVLASARTCYDHLAGRLGVAI